MPRWSLCCAVRPVLRCAPCVLLTLDVLGQYLHAASPAPLTRPRFCSSWFYFRFLSGDDANQEGPRAADCTVTSALSFSARGDHLAFGGLRRGG